MFLSFCAPPVFLGAVICGVSVWLSYGNLVHSGLLAPVIAVIVSILFAFALMARILLEITETAVENNARNTYVEISLDEVIVSLYGGSYTMYGEKTVIRRLYIIPLGGFLSASVIKNGKILVKAESLREYAGNSKRLGYFFVNGSFMFTEIFYEMRGFTERSEAVIPAKFGDSERVVREINAAKARFRERSVKPLVKPNRH